ncbi:gluconate kinase, FGGY family [Anaerolinea thermolimosa]|uniref:Gluconate kinase, FGGY family n=1 Tax=Anaerolinea thermolimosa TaxID=229919 RepID=A0A7U9KMD9_9CHLR|nr:gluconokinase [Anaerolinea thermolimosa]GAP08451.1 gluconate kinase, FGGY family [Anaerolinea thermolimosa]
MSMFLGIDLGTGSCKAAVLDGEGRVCGAGQGTYPAGEGPRRWNEQPPEALLEGMVQASRQALMAARVSARQIEAVSVGGAMHSLLVLDGSERPLTGVITWADGRGAHQAGQYRGTPQGVALYQRTGCPVHGMYPLYKILWLRDEQPGVFAQAARYVTAKEYVLHALTGEWVVDYSIAAGHGLMDTHTLRWDAEALALAGLREEQFSPLAPPQYLLKLKDTPLVAQAGLLPGTPLVLGCSDAVNSSLGAGAVLPNRATLMVGTSGALRVVARRPILHPRGKNWCYAIDSNHWLVGGAINNGGVALDWLRGVFSRAGGAKVTFDAVAALAGEVPPGAGGVLCLPFFAGERSPNWNLNARGVFFGLALEHGPAHLARALLEGVAFRFRSLAEMLAEVGCEPAEIRASGGFIYSPLWLEIMASVLNRQLFLPEWGETSSWGAAAWAMIGMGAVADLESAGQLVQVNGQVAPDPAQVPVYDHLYALYTRLYENLLPSFEDVARFQQSTER